MQAGAFTIPSFQRRFVWSQSHASKFIESLLMGLPVPGIFLYKEAGTNRSLVIDGQQRLRTLQSFYSGSFGEKRFRLVGVREPWNGQTYNDLDTSDRLKLDDSIVHATIFTQDEPSDVLDSVYFVFERINSGGIRLSPQEIRNCIAAGNFTEAVHELNAEPEWRQVFGGPENKRAKDEELIIRFFAMYDDRSNYTRPLAQFLNRYAIEMNKATSAEIEIKKNLFRNVIAAVKQALNGKAFRPERNLNAAVFDSAMVGIATRLASGRAMNSAELAAAYERLMGNQEYQRGWRRATADEENVKTRMEIAVKAFEEA